MKVFLDVPKFFVRPRNTDWRYVRYQLPRLGEFCGEIETVLPKKVWYGWQENLLYLGHRVFRTTSMGQAMAEQIGLNIPDLAVRRTGAQIVFAHGRFPQNSTLPVVWQNSLLDPAMQEARGVSQGAIAVERKLKTPFFERSAAVQVSTRAEAERLGEWMPHIREKFVAVPFFQPHLQALPSTTLRDKHADAGEVKILFVGNEARRKGLDVVLRALSVLDDATRRQLRFDIVSSMADGKVAVPAADHIKFHGALRHEEVMHLMSQAHVFAMPSRFESYGLTFIEALASGAVPIGPSWETQREILANGSAGILTDGSVGGIAEALHRLVTDASLRSKLALVGHARFETEFEASQVALKYYRMFESVLRQ